ncbi:unnamed protein product [Dracunculus medinensis]|uniref:Ras modification protein ERF4 n=1 Tax=Dracunculus medinensis TaxID=318479 RepID=A0A0N4U3N5_DRAME|nr:unnamed protein product [Dracunculus medinensis]
MSEVNVPLNTCSKIFIQRDYSKGLAVQFDTSFPIGLIGKISESDWKNTITTINTYYSRAEEVCCASVLETFVGCFSCYLSRLFMSVGFTQYENQLKEISRFLSEENLKIYLPAGVYLTDPIERGFRVFEISLITTSPVLPHNEFPVRENYATSLGGTTDG